MGLIVIGKAGESTVESKNFVESLEFYLLNAFFKTYFITSDILYSFTYSDKLRVIGYKKNAVFNSYAIININEHLDFRLKKPIQFLAIIHSYWAS